MTDKRSRIMAIVLFLAAVGASAADLTGTWRVIYLVHYDPQAGDYRPMTVTAKDMANPITAFTFTTDGSGSVAFTGGTVVRLFWNEAGPGMIGIQPQGLGLAAMGYDFLPDGRLIATVTWPIPNEPAIALLAVLERVP